MSLIFFIKSATVDISRYTIKDIPGSSGRLDVISRCILSALTLNNKLERNIQLWAFLDKYGTFIFDSNSFVNEQFPKNENKLSDFFVEIIKKSEKREEYPETLNPVKYSKLSIIDAIEDFVNKNYKAYVLNENGIDFLKEFKKLRKKDNLLFIVGDQSGDILNCKELKKLNLTNLSLGNNRSYLASSVIRLIKMNLQLLI